MTSYRHAARNSTNGNPCRRMLLGQALFHEKRQTLTLPVLKSQPHARLFFGNHVSKNLTPPPVSEDLQKFVNSLATTWRVKCVRRIVGARIKISGIFTKSWRMIGFYFLMPVIPLNKLPTETSTALQLLTKRGTNNGKQ